MTDIPDLPQIPSSATDSSGGHHHDLYSTGSYSSSRTQRSSVYFSEQDEGVLRDVLEELDRERHKRAELEAQVRVLQEELHSQRRKSSQSTKTSVKDYTMVVTERDGYKEILDAITEDRPAFSAQNQNDSNNSLPIHIIRLLEVMPWDARAQQYVFGMEQVYEWQIYTADKKWQKELRYFPQFFKSLPIVIPTPGKTVSEASRNNNPFGGIMIAPPKQCLLTNLDVTTILNIDKGYPLPENGGGWTWVGPWKVEKNMETDEQGWMYSNDIQIRVDPSSYCNEFKLPEKGKANIMKRRRKWTRLRVLIDYPYASHMTRQYLKLVSEKAASDVNVDKLSGQLVETKMALTTIQADRLAYQERTNARIKELERELQDKNEILGSVETGAGLNLTSLAREGSTTSFGSAGSDHSAHKEYKKVDQVAEIRSAVTQWVSNTVQKQRKNSNGDVAAAENGSSNVDTKVNGESSAKATSTPINPMTAQEAHDAKQQLFDSLRDKGSGLFEILKQKGGEELDKIKQGGGGLPWQRKEANKLGSRSAHSTAGDSASTTMMNGKSNVYMHGTRAKLASFHSESSNANDE